MRVPRRFLAPFVLFALVASAAMPAMPADPVQVNVILSLTGFAATIGQPEKTGLEVFEKRVNANGGIRGRPVQFVIADDQSNNQVTVQLANQLIAKNVPIFLGPTIVGACSAVAPLLKSGPVMFCLSPGGSPAPGSFWFTNGIAAHDLMATQVHYLHERGFKRVAWISSTDASGQDGELAFDEALAKPENGGMTVADREHFNVSDLGVDAQMAKIKAAQPEAIVTWTSGAQMQTIMRGISTAGLEKVVLFISAANLGFNQLKQFAPLLPVNSYTGTNAIFSADVVSDKAVKQAILDMASALTASGSRVDYLSSMPWDPASIVVSALRKLGPTPTAEQMRSYIANLRDFTGADGRFDFQRVPQRGLTAQNAYIVRWDPAGDRFVPVSRAGGIPLPQ
jgi:branched-chain amino acid transport system substrate-binding protein